MIKYLIKAFVAKLEICLPGIEKSVGMLDLSEGFHNSIGRYQLPLDNKSEKPGLIWMLDLMKLPT